MSLSFSSRTIKYLIWLFNFFFLISGIIILSVGAAVKTVYKEYDYFLDDKYFSLPNMLIATGTIIFFICFFGCCGAFKESWIMLAIFSVLLGIIFIFELSAGIAGYVLRDKTYSYLQVKLQNNLEKYNESHAMWDLLQSNFECCGVNTYNDWSVSFGNELPISCCPMESGTVGSFFCNTNLKKSALLSAKKMQSTIAITETTTDRDNVTTSTPIPTSTTTANPKSTSTPYTTGCAIVFGEFVKKHAVQIGGCAIGLAIMQLLGIFFSCYLMRQLKYSYCST
ncbi:CD63 antigen-like isoform X1 [Rhynchophorus ferrugineus]|uniref:CD63 antigen-like isoform X1 n=1 Tax=Rhynchophorus ferrugineus TaxID=354439 RepID=UPI003FCD74A6